MLVVNVNIYCDGQEALRKASIPLRWARGAGAQYDILGAIWNLRRRLRCSPTFLHVKGHQKLPLDELDIQSRLNHQMDFRAKSFLRTCPPVPSSDIFLEPWYVSVSGEKFSGNLRTDLREHCTASDLLTWWSYRQKPQASSFHLTDWDALHSAMESLRLTRRHWIAKHAAGICGVGKVLKRWKWQRHDQCPRCSQPEDAVHVWVCQAAPAVAVWEDSIERLNLWMKKSNTLPLLREFLCRQLLRWKRGEDLHVDCSCPPLFLQAIQDQAQIGWHAFLEGRVSKHWAVVQQAHYTSIGKKNTGQRWLSLLIRKLLDVAWDQWEHRCGQAHQQAETAHDQSIRQAVEEALRGGPGQLTGRDRQYFQFPERVRALPTSKKAGWLANVDAAFRRLEFRNERRRNSQQAERACMRAWLQGRSAT